MPTLVNTRGNISLEFTHVTRALRESPEHMRKFLKENKAKRAARRKANSHDADYEKMLHSSGVTERKLHNIHKKREAAWTNESKHGASAVRAVETAYNGYTDRNRGRLLNDMRQRSAKQKAAAKRNLAKARAMGRGRRR